MSEDQWPGIRLLLIVVLALAVGFLAGWRASITFGTDSHRRYLPPAFTPFPMPSPSPTIIPGLHDYALPVNEPAATPSASSPTSRPSSPGRPREHREVGQAPRHRAREIAGKASWHATGRSGLYAAACAPLRKAIGSSWRGRRVLVAYGRQAVEVVLNDWCGSRDKTIDLSDEAFRYFAPLSRGVIRVTVGW